MWPFDPSNMASDRWLGRLLPYQLPIKQNRSNLIAENFLYLINSLFIFTFPIIIILLKKAEFY